MNLNAKRMRGRKLKSPHNTSTFLIRQQELQLVDQGFGTYEYDYNYEIGGSMMEELLEQNTTNSLQQYEISIQFFRAQHNSRG